MNLRKRFFLSFVVTLLIVGSAVVVWGERSGKFTIFGDSSGATNSDASITSAIDLSKGVAAGDGQTQLTSLGIELLPLVRSGNAIFTFGQRDVVKIYRVVPEISQALGASSHISMQFAGSIDGVSYNEYSPTQTVAFDVAGKAQPIDLDFLIPGDSRFIRVKAILDRTDSSESPVFGGFTVNYDLPSLTVTTDSQNVLVNGSPINASSDSAPANPGKPDSLVVTGIEWWPFALAGLWIVCIIAIFRITPIVEQRVEGAHGSRTTPGS